LARSKFSTIYTADNDYQVIVEVAPQYQLDIQCLSKALRMKQIIQLPVAQVLVPLSTVATLENSRGSANG